MAIGAGPKERRVRSESIAPEIPPDWFNLRPLGTSTASAPGHWLDLLASIGHDLRTPLNAVIGFSDVMSKELLGPIGNRQYQEYVQHIRSSGMELLVAAERALTMTALLAEPKLAQIHDVSLEALVQDALAELFERAQPRVGSIRIEIASNLQVRGDHRVMPRAIRQMIAATVAQAPPGSHAAISAVTEHGLVEFRVAVR